MYPCEVHLSDVPELASPVLPTLRFGAVPHDKRNMLKGQNFAVDVLVQVLHNSSGDSIPKIQKSYK